MYRKRQKNENETKITNLYNLNIGLFYFIIFFNFVYRLFTLTTLHLAFALAPIWL